jgi:hypothetical protein
MLPDFRARLETDVATTLGRERLILVQAAAAQLLDAQLDVTDEKVVDDVQQAIHDTFVDPTWPQCPRHHNHPLWYRDGQWWCDADDVSIARLGELRSL